MHAFVSMGRRPHRSNVLPCMNRFAHGATKFMPRDAGCKRRRGVTPQPSQVSLATKNLERAVARGVHHRNLAIGKACGEARYARDGSMEMPAMTPARWYFDFVSPFAYLQLPAMHALRERLDVAPVPIVFGAVLARHGQLGPAEIAGKREFTYRFVQWQAGRAGVRLRFPPAHPFNSLAALRLCVAAGGDWPAVTAIFEHLWRDGRDGTSAAALAGVAHALGIDDAANAIAQEPVKGRLRANTDAALAAGVFGVPTLAFGGELYWGNDATPMIESRLADPSVFDSEEYRRIATLPVGVERARADRGSGGSS
jgi:2-hydroxychromene-2-carboxylate isomerase